MPIANLVKHRRLPINIAGHEDLDSVARPMREQKGSALANFTKPHARQDH